MKASKTQNFIFGVVLTAVMGSSTSAFAATSLLDGALNSSLEEKANVTAEYKSNPAADRPDHYFNDRVRADRIELTMDGELNGGSAGDRLKDFDSPNRIYREGRIQAKLDKELESIDRAYSKTEVVQPAADKAEGFQYSEGRLPK